MRIGIVGTGGVGKSTLLKQLTPFLEERGYKVVTEITRKIKARGLPINQDALNYDETQMLILGSHLNNLSYPKMISDRCMIDGYAYTEYLSLQNKVTTTARDAVANALEVSIKMYDLIIYVPIEFAAEDDGVRDTDNKFRLGVDQIMRTYIAEGRMNRGYSFIHDVTGSIEDRVQKVKSLIINHE